jgi:hypothetical protein
VLSGEAQDVVGQHFTAFLPWQGGVKCHNNRRHPGGCGAFQRADARTVGNDQRDFSGAEFAVFFSVEQGLKVGAAAGDEHHDVDSKILRVVACHIFISISLFNMA